MHSQTQLTVNVVNMGTFLIHRNLILMYIFLVIYVYIIVIVVVIHISGFKYNYYVTMFTSITYFINGHIL